MRKKALSAMAMLKISSEWSCFHDHGLPAFELCMLVAAVVGMTGVVLLLSSKIVKGINLQQKERAPPGPRGLPVIGHLHKLRGGVPHQALYELSKQYGPLMSLKFGAVPVVVASSSHMAQQILQTHDAVFAGRPRTTATIYLQHDGADIAFSQPDRQWRFKRQLCSSHLFSPKRLRHLRWARETSVDFLMRSLFQLSHDDRTTLPLVVRPKLLEASNSTISRMLFGNQLSELSKETFISLITETIHLLGEPNVGDYVPCLSWLALQGYARRCVAVSAKLNSFLQAIIDARRQERKEKAVKDSEMDLLDALLSNSSSSNGQLPDDHIMGVLQDAMQAGTGSTAHTIEWALAELVSNPEKLKRAQEEIDEVVGTSRRVGEDDITQLPYLQAVVKETFRLHPTGPLLVPHVACKSCKIEDWYISSGTQALVNVWAIGRDPQAWEKPSSFIPERFLVSNIDLRGFPSFQLLPFGSGCRACPGWSLGLLNVQSILASLLHGFEWAAPSKPDMSELFFLELHMSSPLTVLLKPKFPPCFYA